MDNTDVAKCILEGQVTKAPKVTATAVQSS